VLFFFFADFFFFCSGSEGGASHQKKKKQAFGSVGSKKKNQHPLLNLLRRSSPSPRREVVFHSVFNFCLCKHGVGVCHWREALLPISSVWIIYLGASSLGGNMFLVFLGKTPKTCFSYINI